MVSLIIPEERFPRPNPDSTPVPANYHYSNDYDPVVPSSIRAIYKFRDHVLSIICNDVDLSDSQGTSDPINSDENDATIARSEVLHRIPIHRVPFVTSHSLGSPHYVQI